MGSQKWYKLKYIGETFGIDELTNGKIYSAIEDGDDMYRVVDDSDEDYLYDKYNPRPTDDSSKGGKWEIIEAIDCQEPSAKLKYVAEIDKKLNDTITSDELKRCLSIKEIDSKYKIMEYLYDNPIILMKNNVKDDVLDKDMGAIGTEFWRSDGVYKWSSSLIYYFINYNLKLDDAFLEHVLGKEQ